MKFEEVMKHFREGKKIKRYTWIDSKYFLSKDNFDHECNKHNSTDSILINLEGLLASDWQVYKETFDFMTAIRYVDAGKKIRRNSWKLNFPNLFIEKNDCGKIIGNCSDKHMKHVNFSPHMEDIYANDWELYD